LRSQTIFYGFVFGLSKELFEGCLSRIGKICFKIENQYTFDCQSVRKKGKKKARRSNNDRNMNKKAKQKKK
jgi:hypothetical protein